MNLYAEYIKEREGIDLLEKDYGFCTYSIVSDINSIYLIDTYVKKDKRREGFASKFFDEVIEIGKDSGCCKIIGGFCLSTNGWQKGKNVLKANGFKYLSKDKNTNMIFVFKEI